VISSIYFFLTELAFKYRQNISSILCNILVVVVEREIKWVELRAAVGGGRKKGKKEVGGGEKK
jgi:hypothetical protein